MGNELAATATPGAIADYMPVMTSHQAVEVYNLLVDYVKKLMVDGRDYGVIPGTGGKPTLLKPGAEKLCKFFGLHVEKPEMMEKCEDWTGKDHGGEPFFYYCINQTLTRNGQVVASQFGSINSWESKYRWRWVQAADVPAHLNKDKLAKRGGTVSEFTFSIEKAETTGQYGKPAEHWKAFQDAIAKGTARRIKRKTKAGKELDAYEIESTVYRVPNEDVFSQINTLQKMAQKRAMIAACLVATNASEFFNQDLDEIVDVEFEHAPPKQPEPPTRPANGDNPKTAPKKAKTGADLLKRLEAKDAEMHAAGLIGQGELLAFIANEGERLSLPEDIKAWGPETFGPVAKLVEQFAESARRRQADHEVELANAQTEDG